MNKPIAPIISAVSIHALTRSATEMIKELFKTIHVSIHALTRSATLQTWLFLPYREFQSTHSRGVRQIPAHEIIGTSRFQSTHSRGVRRKIQTALSGNKVSIHALTRSATGGTPTSYPTLPVSIHALTRSATSAIIQCNSWLLFQSTHSRGVRHDSYFISR